MNNQITKRKRKVKLEFEAHDFDEYLFIQIKFAN